VTGKTEITKDYQRLPNVTYFPICSRQVTPTKSGVLWCANDTNDTKFFFWPVSFDAPKQWKCLIDSILVWGSGPTQNATFCGMVAFSTPQLSQSVDGYLS